MAAGKITEVVDDAAVAQLEALIQKLGLARAEMASGIETALKYNAALGGATMANFTKANDDAVKSIERVKAANEDLATSQKAVAEKEAAIVQQTAQKLLDAEAKKQAAAEATMNKYLQLMSKQDAAMQAQMDKEIRAAQQKADRIAEIERRAANNRPTGNGAYETGSSAQLTRDQADAIAAKTRAQQAATLATAADIAAENQQAQATATVTTATQQETQALSAQDKLLNSVNGSLNQNISQQLKYQLELKSVQSQLKANSGDTNSLKIREEELKAAIASQSLIIKQQVKDQQAAVGSQDQMLARLNLLRKAYNSLTDEERKNAEIGGVLLADIKKLSAATTEINQSQGKYNDSVGEYENAIKRAISAYVPYGSQLVQGVDSLKKISAAQGETTSTISKLGFAFAGFTIAGFAVAISSAVYYLGLFQDTGNRVDILLAGLKGRFADFGQKIVEKVSDSTPGKQDDLKTIANWAKSLANAFSSTNQSASDNAEAIQKLRIEYEKYNDVVTQNIAKLDQQANLERAKGRDKKLGPDGQNAAYAEAARLEDEALKLATAKSNSRIDLAIKEANQYNKLSDENTKRLKGGDIELAAQLAKQGSKGGISIQAYDDLKEGYAEQTALIGRLTTAKQRAISLADNAELKGAKQANTDLLELAKERLTGEQQTAKLILDDQQQSFAARLAALKVYITRSRDLIENENEIANAAPGISGTKVKSNNQRAKNQNNQVDAFDLAERQKIQKEINESVTEDYKKRLAIIVGGEKSIEDVIENSLNNQLLANELTSSIEILRISEKYRKGIIDEKEYNYQINTLKRQAAKEAIDIQIDALEKIAGAQAAAAAIGAGDPKAAQGTANRITKLKIQSNQLASDQTGADAKFDVEKFKKEAKEVLTYTAQAIKGLELAKSALQAQADAEIASLEKKAQLIDENATKEKAANDKSIASSKTKAANDAVIDARALQAKNIIAEQERKIKQRQAEYDKALSIAKIIQATATAVVEALPNYVLAAIVGALGAAELAVVASSPLPQYYTGTESSKEGFAHVGERGTELMQTPDGRLSLTPSTDTVTYLKKGTKIINNENLMRMLAKPEPINYVGGQAIDMKRLEKLMEENNELQRKQPKPNVRVTVNGDWNNYANKYFA